MCTLPSSTSQLDEPIFKRLIGPVGQRTPACIRYGLVLRMEQKRTLRSLQHSPGVLASWTPATGGLGWLQPGRVTPICRLPPVHIPGEDQRDP